MSLTQTFIGLEEKQDNIKSALQALIDHERLGHPASIGIAKKIIAHGNLEALSKPQRAVFDEHIVPALKLQCDQCQQTIPLHSIGEALMNEQVDGLVCNSCANLRNHTRTQ
jgi:hypothetical protein